MPVVLVVVRVEEDLGCPCLIYLGTPCRWVCLIVTVLGGILLATIEFVVAQVLLLIAIGVINTALSLICVRCLTSARRPVMLLQPMKTAVVLTPAFLFILVLLMHDRRGIPVLGLTLVPPTLMQVFVPVFLFRCALGCRQANGLIAVCGLTMVSLVMARMIDVFLLIL